MTVYRMFWRMAVASFFDAVEGFSGIGEELKYRQLVKRRQWLLEDIAGREKGIEIEKANIAYQRQCEARMSIAIVDAERQRDTSVALPR